MADVRIVQLLADAQYRFVARLAELLSQWITWVSAHRNAAVTGQVFIHRSTRLASGEQHAKLRPEHLCPISNLPVWRTCGTIAGLNSMQRRPPTELSDYWDIFLRRWRWVIIPAVLIFVCVATVSTRIPKLYKSETLILVDPQKVPADYVKATISGDVTDRLQTISQEI